MILVWICVLLTISSTIKGSPLPQVLRDSNVSGGILKLKMPLHVFIYRTIETIKFAGQIYHSTVVLQIRSSKRKSDIFKDPARYFSISFYS